MLEITALAPNTANTSCAPDLPSPAQTDHKPNIVFSTLGNNQTSTTWTNEQLNRGLALWAEGKSGTQLADALNAEFGTNYTKNAVIGKIWRSNPAQRTKENRGNWVRRNTIKRPKPEEVPDITDLSIPFAQRKTLFELERGICKWPVGNPDEPNFFFCGGKSLATASYCAGHAKRAYHYR